MYSWKTKMIGTHDNWVIATDTELDKPWVWFSTVKSCFKQTGILDECVQKLSSKEFQSSAGFLNLLQIKFS